MIYKIKQRPHEIEAKARQQIRPDFRSAVIKCHVKRCNENDPNREVDDSKKRNAKNNLEYDFLDLYIEPAFSDNKVPEHMRAQQIPGCF